MKAITVAESGLGVDALSWTDIDYPHAAENDVIVRVHAAGSTRGELTWPGTWIDRAGHDRAPSVPGHELAGGEVFERSLGVLRAGGRLVTMTGPPPRRPENGQAIFFVVEPDRARLADLGRRVQDGRLRPIVGSVRPLAEAAAAFAPDQRVHGRTIITITEGS